MGGGGGRISFSQFCKQSTKRRIEMREEGHEGRRQEDRGCAWENYAGNLPIQRDVSPHAE